MKKTFLFFALFALFFSLHAQGKHTPRISGDLKFQLDGTANESVVTIPLLLDSGVFFKDAFGTGHPRIVQFNYLNTKGKNTERSTNEEYKNSITYSKDKTGASLSVTVDMMSLKKAGVYDVVIDALVRGSSETVPISFSLIRPSGVLEADTTICIIKQGDNDLVSDSFIITETSGKANFSNLHFVQHGNLISFSPPHFDIPAGGSHKVTYAVDKGILAKLPIGKTTETVSLSSDEVNLPMLVRFEIWNKRSKAWIGIVIFFGLCLAALVRHFFRDKETETAKALGYKLIEDINQDSNTIKGDSVFPNADFLNKARQITEALERELNKKNAGGDKAHSASLRIKTYKGLADYNLLRAALQSEKETETIKECGYTLIAAINKDINENKLISSNNNEHISERGNDPTCVDFSTKVAKITEALVTELNKSVLDNKVYNESLRIKIDRTLNDYINARAPQLIIASGYQLIKDINKNSEKASAHIDFTDSAAKITRKLEAELTNKNVLSGKDNYESLRIKIATSLADYDRLLSNLSTERETETIIARGRKLIEDIKEDSKNIYNVDFLTDTAKIIGLLETELNKKTEWTDRVNNESLRVKIRKSLEDYNALRGKIKTVKNTEVIIASGRQLVRDINANAEAYSDPGFCMYMVKITSDLETELNKRTACGDNAYNESLQIKIKRALASYCTAFETKAIALWGYKVISKINDNRQNFTDTAFTANVKKITDTLEGELTINSIYGDKANNGYLLTKAEAALANYNVEAKKLSTEHTTIINVDDKPKIGEDKSKIVDIKIAEESDTVPKWNYEPKDIKIDENQDILSKSGSTSNVIENREDKTGSPLEDEHKLNSSKIEIKQSEGADITVPPTPEANSFPDINIAGDSTTSSKKWLTVAAVRTAILTGIAGSGTLLFYGPAFWGTDEELIAMFLISFLLDITLGTFILNKRETKLPITI